MTDVLLHAFLIYMGIGGTWALLIAGYVLIISASVNMPWPFNSAAALEFAKLIIGWPYYLWKWVKTGSA